MAAVMVSAAREVKHTITSTEANIGLYVQTEQLANFVLTDDEEHRYGIMLPPLLRLFSSFQKAFERYVEVRVLAPDGYEDARLSQEKNISEYENNSPFFREISNSPDSVYTTFFINPDNDQFNMIVSHRIQMFDRISARVTKKPPLRGYLVLTFSLDFLQQQVEENRFGRTGILFYTDAQGRILYHPDREVGKTNLSAAYFSQLKHLADTGQEMGPVSMEGSWAYAKGEKIHPGLYLFAVLAEEEYDEAGRTQWALIVLGVMAFALTIIFGSIYALINVQILVPLNRLNRAVKTIGRGELDSNLSVNRNDEIGQLSQEFNAMVEKLRKITVSHDYVDGILESMNDSVWVISDQGIVQKANTGACEFTGYEKHELIGRSFFEFFPENTGDLAEKIAQGIRTVNLEKTMTRKDGSQTPVFVSTSSMVYSKENNDIICVVHDISDRIKMEQEKSEAQKVAGEQTKHALIGQVAGKIAHDFNNILGIVMGHSELALMKSQDIETQKTLELILGQTIRGKNLTKDLVSFAKNQEPKQELFRIDEKIEFVINLC